jgi:hypothetical protein
MVLPICRERWSGGAYPDLFWLMPEPTFVEVKANSSKLSATHHMSFGLAAQYGLQTKAINVRMEIRREITVEEPEPLGLSAPGGIRTRAHRLERPTYSRHFAEFDRALRTRSVLPGLTTPLQALELEAFGSDFEVAPLAELFSDIERWEGFRLNLDDR